MLEALGSLAGSALGQLGDALSAPRRAIWSALGLPETGSELVANTFGMDKDSPWTHALGIGAEMLGDPLTYAGGLLGKGAGLLAKGAGEAATGVKALSPLRRTFGMVKNVTEVPTQEAGAVAAMARDGSLPARVIADPTGRFVAEKSGPLSRSLASDALTQDAPAIASGEMGGTFYPRSNMGLSADATANRHEAVHGLINAAVQYPQDAGRLPLAMRVPAAMERAGQDSPLLKGMGRVLNEAAAHGYQNRGALRQIGGYADFLLDPTAQYARQFAETSPLAAAIYRSTPYAVAGGLGAGAGGLGFLAMQN